MCTLCTKCTLACRGGEECRFVSRLPRERRHAACVDVKRSWLHGAWWRAPGGREGLWTHRLYYRYTTVCPVAARTRPHPPPRSPCALRMPMCPCGFLSGCHLCAVWVPPSPRVRCRKACITLTLPYTLYGTQSGAPASYGYALYGSCSRQSRERMDLDLSVSFRKVYVNLTEPSLSSGIQCNQLHGTGGCASF